MKVFLLALFLWLSSLPAQAGFSFKPIAKSPAKSGAFSNASWMEVFRKKGSSVLRSPIGKSSTTQIPPDLYKPGPCDPEDFRCIEERRRNEPSWSAGHDEPSPGFEISHAEGVTSIRLDRKTKAIGIDQFFSVYAKSLGLTAKDEMKPDRQFPSPSTPAAGEFRDGRYKRFFQGLEVFGGEYAVHEVKDPATGAFTVGSAMGRSGFVFPFAFDVVPKMTSAAAFECAKAAAYAEAHPVSRDLARPVGKIVPSSLSPKALKPNRFLFSAARPPASDADEASKGVLGIGSVPDPQDPAKRIPVLVWRFASVTTSDPFGDYVVEIDASKTSCRTVSVASNVREAGGTPEFTKNVPCQGTGLFEKSPVSFIADLGKDGEFRLVSDRKDLSAGGIGTQARQATIDDRQPNSQGEDGQMETFRDDPDKEGDLACDFRTPDDAPGVDVHYYVQKMMEFLQAQFGWLGLDGKGEVPVLSYLQSQISLNAFYRVNEGLFFGTSESDTELPPVDMETVGHEFGHGVVHYTSANVYQDESAAINEAMADVFGVIFSFWMGGKNANWQFGEQVYKQGSSTSLRDLEDPYRVKNPREYDGRYFVGNAEHQQGAVVGHWFYLIVNGGSGVKEDGKRYEVEPLDPDPKTSLWQASQIVFATLKKIPPDVTFIGFARAAKLATDELVTSGILPGDPQHYFKTVVDAFAAVNLAWPYDKRFYSPTMVEGVGPWPVTFVWGVSSKEIGWRLRYSKDWTFQKDVRKVDIYETDSELSERYEMPVASYKASLEAGQSYFWQILVLEDKDPNPAPETSGRSAPFSKATPWADIKQRLPDNWGTVSDFETDAQYVVLESPQDGEQDVVPPWKTPFRWKPVGGATSYDLLVSENPDAPCDRTGQDAVVSVDAQTSLEGAFVTGEAGLKGNTPYFYKVKAYGPKDGDKAPAGDCGLPFGFKTGIPPTPESIAPKDATVQGGSVPFQWKAVEGADHYVLTYYENKDGAAGNQVGSPDSVPADSATKDGIVTSSVPIAGSASGYCWRVEAYGPLGDASPLSEASCFRFIQKPVITSPNNGETIPRSEAESRQVVWQGDSPNGYVLFFCDGSQTPPSEGQSAFRSGNCATGEIVTDGTGRPFFNNWTMNNERNFIYVANIVSCEQIENVGTDCILGAVSDRVRATIKYPKVPQCGDGVLDSGEACDDGNTANGDTCEANCTLPVCGNGITDAGEQCDGGSCCNPSCAFTPYGEKFCPVEGTDTCQKISLCDGAGKCMAPQPTCGDKVIESGCGEQCDDGNQSNGDGCSSTCKTETAQSKPPSPSMPPSQESCTDLGEAQVTQITPCTEQYGSYCVVSGSVSFTWEPVSGAASYKVEVIQFPSYSYVVYGSASTTGTSATVPLSLAGYVGEVGVNVYAVNACGNKGTAQGKGMAFYAY